MAHPAIEQVSRFRLADIFFLQLPDQLAPSLDPEIGKRP